MKWPRLFFGDPEPVGEGGERSRPGCRSEPVDALPGLQRSLYLHHAEVKVGLGRSLQLGRLGEAADRGRNVALLEVGPALPVGADCLAANLRTLPKFADVGKDLINDPNGVLQPNASLDE